MAVFLVYSTSTALHYLLYYRRPVDWHQLFAYLTVIGFTGLVLSGALMLSKKSKRWKELHIIFGIVASITLVITLFMFRYAIPY